MRNLKPDYVTSFTLPELRVREDRWGASSSPNLIPFQVFTIQADSNRSKKGKMTYYYDGITRSKVNSLNAISDSELHRINKTVHGLGLDRYNIFFRPNPVVTTAHPSFKIRAPYQGAPMNDIPYLPSIEYKGSRSMWLAAIQFVSIDIDFKHTSKRKADSLLQELRIKPSTLVSSGSGYHAYFSVKHIHLVTKKKLDFTVDLITAHSYEYKLKQLTSNISHLLGGDSTADKNVLGLLRVPETVNYKIVNDHPVIRDCEYVYGDLCEDYKNPQYTLEELINAFCPELDECKSATSFQNMNVQHNPRSRPRQNDKKWMIAHSNFRTYFGITGGVKSFGKYFEYIYGHRMLDYYIENPSKVYGKRAGIKSEQLKKHRQTMLNLGVIEKLSDSDRSRGLSAKYKVTPLFFRACGLNEPETIRHQDLSYAPHTLRKRMISDLKWLQKTGTSRARAESYIREKLERRDMNQGDEEDLLTWGLNTFF